MQTVVLIRESELLPYGAHISSEGVSRRVPTESAAAMVAAHENDLSFAPVTEPTESRAKLRLSWRPVKVLARFG